ncbi:MAG: hypothetical protein QG577_87, partial [Thermodesulfobacteriota bacterium]|nr:hypothetical protein [Thermodesulfobacteriota bacterium]
MSNVTLEKILKDIDEIHRDLARKSLDIRLGRTAVLNTGDILESHQTPLRPKTWEFLKKTMRNFEDKEGAERIERVLYACADLAIEEQVASLADMLNFYMERGRMHVEDERVPALEVVPWLQGEADFQKRETMLSECNIFFKGIVNPMLLAMLELTIRAVKEKFGFSDFAAFCEKKKQADFNKSADTYQDYLTSTQDIYDANMAPWVEEVIGRPFENIGRFHALYLLRIKTHDRYFPVESLGETVARTFRGIGLDLSTRDDIKTNLATYTSKNPDGVCIGIEIPGDVHVLMKPVGGLIDVETLLHEMGHAFFLGHFDQDLPLEYRRIYRSPALDETFAFLFMELIENPAWAVNIAGMPTDQADELARITRVRKLCLIRRYIGKFLAELELHRRGNIKNHEPYCRRLHEATGFVYEPQGYLVDMDPDFYSYDYLLAWAGANVLRNFLENQFGAEWFTNVRAGDFLRMIASSGRRYSLEETLISACGQGPSLPHFS